MKGVNNDHDLLITLNTKFESFEVSFSRAFINFDEKMSRILVQMEQKADKSDIKLLRDDITNIENRLKIVEEKIKLNDAKKEFIINLGNMGIKGWSFIAGVILFIMGIINALKK